MSDSTWFTVEGNMATLPSLLTICINCLTASLFICTVSTQDKISLGCFGSAGACLDHKLTCSNTSRVAIEKAVYGHKTWLNCTTGVIDCADPCCRYLSGSDCFHVFKAHDIADAYRNCTEHACEFRTPRLVELCSSSGTSFQAVSSYSVVEYECVDESTIIPMCGAIRSRSGRSVSVIYDPKKQYKEASEDCWCTVWQITNRRVTIEGIDLRLNSNTHCGQIRTQDNFGTTYYDCNNSSLWPHLTLKTTTSAFTHVLLSGKPEFAWIRFRADDTLYVSCSSNGQHTTTTSPPTTTTLPTTSTVTYPTASPNVDTRVPSLTMSTGSSNPNPTPKSNASTGDPSSPERMTTGKITTAAPGDGVQGANQGKYDDVTVGAAVGGVAGAVILLIIVVLVFRKCRRESSNPTSEENKTVDKQVTPKQQQPTPVYDNVPGTNNGMVNKKLPSSTTHPNTVTPVYDNIQKKPEEHTYEVIKPGNKTTDNAVVNAVANKVTDTEQPKKQQTMDKLDELSPLDNTDDNTVVIVLNENSVPQTEQSNKQDTVDKQDELSPLDNTKDNTVVIVLTENSVPEIAQPNKQETLEQDEVKQLDNTNDKTVLNVPETKEPIILETKGQHDDKTLDHMKDSSVIDTGHSLSPQDESLNGQQNENKDLDLDLETGAPLPKPEENPKANTDGIQEGDAKLEERVKDNVVVDTTSPPTTDKTAKIKDPTHGIKEKEAAVQSKPVVSPTDTVKTDVNLKTANPKERVMIRL